MSKESIKAVTDLVETFINVPYVIQIIVVFLAIYIMITKLSGFNEYKVNRRHKTTGVVLSYAESVLKNIKSEALLNMKQIMIDARGSDGMSEMDRFELSAIRLAITESLEMQTKSHIKTILRENGYYRKILEHENIDDLVFQRATELRNISLDAVEGVLRDSSPLQGMAEIRFSYTKSEKLFKAIIDKHFSEIIKEEKDINDRAMQVFWVFGQLIAYTHDGIKQKKSIS